MKRMFLVGLAATVSIVLGILARKGKTDAHAALSSQSPSRILHIQVDERDLPKSSMMVKEAVLPGILETTGMVTFDDRKVATISSRVQGRIENVRASVWDSVVKGQPILDLYSPDFMTAEAEYLQAKSMKTNQGLSGVSSWMLDAAKRKLELLGMSEEDIGAITAPSTVITVRAPESGTILQNQSVRGSAVNPGDVLYQLGTLDHVWITADLYEVDMGRVAVGQSLSAVTAAYPDKVFHGKISRISPSIDPNVHTAQIKCEIDNSALKLKPQMLARVRIMTKPGAAMIIPQDSLVFDANAYYAFVEAAGSKVERRQVEVSTWNEQGFARVVSGVRQGERVMPQALWLNARWHEARGESY